MSETTAETLDLRTLVPPARWAVLLVLTTIGALATWAAFPPLDRTGLAWVAPTLLMLVASQVPPRLGFLHGWLFGTLLMGGILSFVAPYGALPWIVLSAVMGLFYGLFGALASGLRGAPPLVRVPALAGAWFLVEFFRGHVGSLSLTFGDLAYSQAENLPYIQIASLVGHYGVGFLMALMSAGLSCFILALLPITWLRPVNGGRLGRQRFNRDAGRVAAACLGLVVVCFAWGRFTEQWHLDGLQRGLAAHTVRVAAVQAEGITARGRQMTDTILDDYERLSRQQPSDLVVWPETAVGSPLNLDRGRMARVSLLAQSLRAHMLVGAWEIEQGRTYNSAYFVRPDGALAGTYRKMDLVMFGEYVPGRERFPFLKHYPIRPFDFTAGRARQLFQARDYVLSPLICFEGIFPEQTREICRRGAELVVIITSDAWAKGKDEVRVHSATAPFRAIEARKYLVRAASVGRSAVIDPFGKVVSEVPFWQNGVAAASVAPRSGLSPYHRVGDWPLLIVSVVALVLGLVRARRGTFILGL